MGSDAGPSAPRRTTRRPRPAPSGSPTPLPATSSDREGGAPPLNLPPTNRQQRHLENWVMNYGDIWKSHSCEEQIQIAFCGYTTSFFSGLYLKNTCLKFNKSINQP